MKLTFITYIHILLGKLWLALCQIIMQTTENRIFTIFNTSVYLNALKSDTFMQLTFEL